MSDKKKKKMTKELKDKFGGKIGTTLRKKAK